MCAKNKVGTEMSLWVGYELLLTIVVMEQLPDTTNSASH